MAKREYIFVRKTTIDYDRNIIILVQHISDHPDHPVVEGSKLVRVEKYKSNWVIRPHTVFEAVRQSSFFLQNKSHNNISWLFIFGFFLFKSIVLWTQDSKYMCYCFQDGCDFIFTYCDDPKGSLPSAVCKWAASRGIHNMIAGIVRCDVTH